MNEYERRRKRQVEETAKFFHDTHCAMKLADKLDERYDKEEKIGSDIMELLREALLVFIMIWLVIGMLAGFAFGVWLLNQYFDFL